jgi:hypothetical protein
MTSRCLSSLLLIGLTVCSTANAVAVEGLPNPSPTIGSLQSAKPILCNTTSSTFFSDGSNSIKQYKVKRRVVTRKLGSRDTLAFEYTYSSGGFKLGQDIPKPRYDYLSQKADGSIVTLAHEHGFKTSFFDSESQKLEQRMLTYLPAKLAINKSWMGDSATIVDVDQMKSTVTGVEWMDGAPTWIITQEKIDKLPSPVRGIETLEIVYNLNPQTLSTTWVFATGAGTSPGTAKDGPKPFNLLYYARCF